MTFRILGVTSHLVAVDIGGGQHQIELEPTTRLRDQQAFERAKRQQRLKRPTGQALGDYRMIEEGDKIMVYPSDGK